MKTVVPVTFETKEAPETPFLLAKQEWDARFGSVIIQAKNWRLAFFSLVPVLLSLAGISVYLASQRTIVPVYIGLSKDSGEAKFLGKADDRGFEPGENEIKFFLAEFIRLVRSVPSDEIVLKQNWLRAYKFLQRASSEQLNSYANNPDSSIQKRKERNVTVQPLSVVKVPDSNSYQVRWRESLFRVGGQKQEEYTVLGTFHVELSPPDSEDIIRENPLGLYITNFQWNREL